MCIRRELKKWIAMGEMLLLLSAAVAAAQDRPLPEVAKQKTGKTATRVFTNEDLEKSRPPEASSPSRPVSSQVGTGSERREPGHITVTGLLEDASATQARMILNSLQHDEEVLLRRYAEIERKLAGETDEDLRQLYSNSLARRDQTLARKREQIAEVKKAIKAAENNAPASPEGKHEKETGVRK